MKSHNWDAKNNMSEAAKEEQGEVHGSIQRNDYESTNIEDAVQANHQYYEKRRNELSDVLDKERLVVAAGTVVFLASLVKEPEFVNDEYLKYSALIAVTFFFLSVMSTHSSIFFAGESYDKAVRNEADKNDRLYNVTRFLHKLSFGLLLIGLLATMWCCFNFILVRTKVKVIEQNLTQEKLKAIEVSSGNKGNSFKLGDTRPTEQTIDAAGKPVFSGKNGQVRQNTHGEKTK